MAFSLTDHLLLGRVHEATGHGRRVFAACLAAAVQGPVVWVQEASVRAALHPPGLARIFDPGRLILARPKGVLGCLQVMEEALRAGAAPLVVAELDKAPDLTASRRLQLAADTGRVRGLCLIPEGRLVTNAAETRWTCMALPGGPGRQSWEIVKNKRGRLGQWSVALTDAGLRVLAPDDAGTPREPA